jgi:hypothetical protein
MSRQKKRGRLIEEVEEIGRGLLLRHRPGIWMRLKTNTEGYTRLGDPGLLSRYNYCLLAGRSGDRISVGARFSAPGPGAHPAPYTGSFPGVKRQGRGADHPPLSISEFKERVELYVYPFLGLCVLF